MTPEHIAAVTAVIEVLSRINGWQISTLAFLVFVMPWICLIGIAYFFHRRFESVVTMYKNNVVLVEKNEQLTEAYKEHLGEFKDIILLNTQVFTKLTAAIEANQFCPMLRLEKQAKGVQA